MLSAAFLPLLALVIIIIHAAVTVVIGVAVRFDAGLVRDGIYVGIGDVLDVIIIVVGGRFLGGISRPS